MARRTTAAKATAANPPSRSHVALVDDRAPDAANVLRAPDGARAELAGDAVELFDPAGRLLIRYRDGALEVSPAHGDLLLASPTGKVRIAAATDVVIEAARDLSMGAQRRFEASAGRPSIPGEAQPLAASRLQLDPQRATLATPSLDVRARSSQVAVGDATVLARQLQLTATRLVTTVEEVERTAGRVVERARDVVQDVTGVLTSRFGRVRSLVRGVYSMRTARTELRSKEDTAIDGRRVLLG